MEAKWGSEHAAWRFHLEIQAIPCIDSVDSEQSVQMRTWARERLVILSYKKKRKNMVAAILECVLLARNPTTISDHKFMINLLSLKIVNCMANTVDLTD